LEVIVALVVLGFLMVGLAQGVRAGLSLRQAQMHRLGDTADLDAAMRVLRSILTRLPVNPAGDRLLTASDGTAFRGEADRITLIGDLPTGVGTTRRAEMTLAVENGQLVLSWRPHYHERRLGAAPPLTRTVLLDGVKRLQLAYWGSPNNNGTATWLSRWESAEAPQLIRVRIEFAKHDPRQWPALIAAAHF
jgi:general secretion pathway protein J